VTAINEQLSAALIDRYVIARELGVGGMATVYLAHDVKHDRDVAIKVLHPDLGAALGSERFLTEIRTTARLQHPHILPLLDSGEAGGLLYYVMPLVTGETLRARLERERQLPIDDVVRIAREVADALGYAHSLGVIHRDIKPENILLQNGHAVVADFGIALAVQTAGGARMTQTGLSLGTPQYMSPEQAMGERRIDARSDIYALGAVVYEMLTGDPPFTGSGVQAIVAKVLTERPSPIALIRDTVPPGVEHAVMTALAKLPADRFATAADFVAAFAGGAGPQLPARRASAVPSPWRLRAILATGAAVVLAIVAVWGWLRPAPSNETVTRVAVAMPAKQQLRPHYYGYSFDLSRDGTRLAYIGPGTIIGSTQLWIRSLDALEATPIAGTEGAISVRWSPDGRSVFFYNTRRSFVVSLDGGQAVPFAGRTDAAWSESGALYYASRPGLISRRRVGGAVDSIIPIDTSFNRFTITVTPDERALLVGQSKRTMEDTSAVELVAVSLSSGQTTRIGPGIYGRILPSGQLLYMSAAGDVFLAPFDAKSFRITGASIPVVHATLSSNAARAYPQISIADNGTMVYMSGAPLKQRLDLVDANGRLERHLDIEGNLWGITLSPDGTRVAFGLKYDSAAARANGIGDTWVEDIRSAARTRLTSSWLDIRPSWSPDGAYVLYTRVGGPVSQALYERRADASESERLVLSMAQFKHSVSEGHWVGDHRTLLVSTYIEGGLGNNLYSFTPGVDAIARPVAATAANESRGVPSPDGKIISYLSDETGTTEMYVELFPGSGARVKVSSGGASAGRWSHDGKELYYWNGTGKLVAASIQTRPALAVIGSREVGGDIVRAQAANDNDGLFDVLPDRRLIVAEDMPGAFQLVMVRNWMGGLAKSTKK
jgi:eukaryotic-like serine/threonine-protein kinase